MKKLETYQQILNKIKEECTAPKILDTRLEVQFL